MSRWTSPRPWAYSSAEATWRPTCAACDGERRRPGVEHPPQRAALEQLHDHERDALVLAPVVDGHHVRVVERGSELCLAPEPAQEALVVGEPRVQDLHRDATAQPHVVSGVDAAARAHTDRAEQAVAAGKDPADEVGHRLAGHRFHGTGHASVLPGHPVHAPCTRRRYRPRVATSEVGQPRRKAIEHPGRFAIVADRADGRRAAVRRRDHDRRHEADREQRCRPRSSRSLPGRARSSRPRSRSSSTSATTSPPTSRSAPRPRPPASAPTIPADQVEFLPGLGQLTFRPGPGQEIEAYEPGVNRVIVTYRSQADPSKDNGVFSWSFTSKS